MIVDSFERGVAAGGVAGLVYGLFMALVGNPLVHQVEHLGHDHGGAEHAHAVSEATTAVVGAASGVLWGILLGAAFGAAYYLFEPSLPGVGSTKAYALAGAGFLTVSGVPWLVLPPVAPGTEQALATDLRLLIYGTMMVLGAVICASSVAAYDRVRHRRGPPAAVGAALVPFVLCVFPVVLVPTNVLAGPELAAAFRWLVVLSQIALWAILAAVYARIDRRAERGEPSVSEFEDDLTAGG